MKNGCLTYWKTTSAREKMVKSGWRKKWRSVPGWICKMTIPSTARLAKVTLT